MKRMTTAIGIAVALAILTPLVLSALAVDDWSRDLSTNRAATDADADHPLMRPITQRFTVEQLDDAIGSLCQDLPAWSTPAKAKPLPADSLVELPAGVDPAAVRHLVRTTSLMRYRDDIWLIAAPLAEDDAVSGGNEKLRLHVESRSRVGKGDLGQNPRNIRELNQQMVSRLVVKAPPPTKAE